MTVTLFLPGALRQAVGGVSELTFEAQTVGEAFAALFDRAPDLRPHLFNENDELRSFVNVFVNDEDIRALDGLKTPLSNGAQVTILPAIAGGKR